MEELRGTDPRRIGPYDIVGVLGSGGMGRVYLGRTASGVAAAVKVIHADLARDPEFRRRFRREVETTASITGPRIAAVLGADVDADHPWLATEYVTGPSLAAAVTEGGPLTPEAAIAAAAGIAEALAAIHTRGLVHRDVKPSNVLLAPDGPRLIDFGIARGATDSRLTRTGVALGTPQFMAPEQIQGDRETTAAADVFALAGVLLYALTGEYPFGEGSAVTLLYRIVHEAPRLEPVRPDLRPLLAACLDKDPEARPSAVEVARELVRLADPERTVEVATGAATAADTTTINLTGAAPDPAADAIGDDPTGAAFSDMAADALTASTGPTAARATGATFGGRPADALTVSTEPAAARATGATFGGGPADALTASTGPTAARATGATFGAGPADALTVSTAAPADRALRSGPRWRKPTAIGAGVVTGVAALIVAVALGSGDSGTASGSGAGKIAGEIPDPLATSLAAGADVVLPNGSTSSAATPSQAPATGPASATPARPTGSPANGSAPGSPTAAAGSTAATSKAGAPESGTSGTSQPKGSATASTASHTTAPPSSSAAPTSAASSSAADTTPPPTRVSSDSGTYLLQNANDSHCVNAGQSTSYVSGPCSGSSAQWKVWEGTPTPGGMLTWQFESSQFPGRCMSTAASSGQLVACSAGDPYQWWSTFKRPAGGQTVNSWNDSHYCLGSYNNAITSRVCGPETPGPAAASWWTLK